MRRRSDYIFIDWVTALLQVAREYAANLWPKCAGGTQPSMSEFGSSRSCDRRLRSVSAESKDNNRQTRLVPGEKTQEAESPSFEHGEIVAFFQYLVTNGTSPDESTVLTFYNGQRKLILKKLRERRHLRFAQRDRVQATDTELFKLN